MHFTNYKTPRGLGCLTISHTAVALSEAVLAHHLLYAPEKVKIIVLGHAWTPMDLQTSAARLGAYWAYTRRSPFGSGGVSFGILADTVRQTQIGAVQIPHTSQTNSG